MLIFGSLLLLNRQLIRSLINKFSRLIKPFFLFLILLFFTLIINPITLAVDSPEGLPPLESHPLPPTLQQWQDNSNNGDYFDKIQTLPFGYLIWSRFPIRVFIQATRTEGPHTAGPPQSWTQAVAQAVQDWAIYLPLQIVDQQEGADIEVLYERPPLSNGQMRARSAQTTYELYLEKRDNQEVLSHRCKILLSPTQVGKYVGAAARHELGHALGIWGHSPVGTDVLYFAQVPSPPIISIRDINTLKRIYEQRTGLGWPYPTGPG